MDIHLRALRRLAAAETVCKWRDQREERRLTLYRDKAGSFGIMWETALAVGPKLDTLTRTYQRIIGPDVGAVIVPLKRPNALSLSFSRPLLGMMIFRNLWQRWDDKRV